MLQTYTSKVNQMCLPERRNTVFTEDILDLVVEITRLDIEFPKHLMQPLFHLLNQKIGQAIKDSNLYHLEILLDALHMMDSSN